MRVVVIGATGNVGSGVLGALLGDDRIEHVIAVARRPPRTDGPAWAGDRDRTQRVSWLPADVAVDDLSFVRGADVVVHLAWLIQPQRDAALLRRVNVEGTRRVVRAVREHDVPALVVASSVGAYAPGPKHRSVGEAWPTTGIVGSGYSQEKAEVERILDDEEARGDGRRIVRMRTGLVFSEHVASEIARYFLGSFVPMRAVGRRWVPVVPVHPRLRFQGLHTDDAGEAYRLAVTSDVHGALNVADDPPLDGPELARVLDARSLRVPRWLLRGGVDVAYRARLLPIGPGWVDLALDVPIMSTERIRCELGWRPQWSATAALAALLDGFAQRSGSTTPALRPEPGGPARTLVPDAGGRRSETG